MDIGSISAGALRHVQQPRPIGKSSSQRRPSTVTIIAAAILLLAAINALFMIKNGTKADFFGNILSPGVAAAYNLAIIILMAYCGVGLLYLNKNSLNIFFWMTGITSTSRLFGDYNMYSLAQDELELIASERIVFGEESGSYREMILNGQIDEIVFGEMILLAIITAICTYLYKNKNKFN